MRALCVLLVLLMVLLTVRAFHPDDVHREANLRCHVCNASYYCLGGQQFDCPANSLAAVALADRISECVCNPGYLREGDLCNLQPQAWYMYGVNETCVSTRETIAAGALANAGGREIVGKKEGEQKGSARGIVHWGCYYATALDIE